MSRASTWALWALMISTGPIEVRAQALLYCPGSTPSVTRDDVAATYTGTGGTGPIFNCQNAATDGCVKVGPASCNVISEDPVTGYMRFGKAGVCTPEAVDIGGTRIQDGQVISTYFSLQYNGVIRHLTGPVPIEGVTRHVPATLGTCNATNEFGIKGDVASGASTGVRTRLCLCTSDGGGTPAYQWRNIGCPNEAGTSTTCPVCP